MECKKILDLANHNVYYVKSDNLNYYINVPKRYKDTNITIELKSKMSNYNLETNDEVWVMENIKNTYSQIDYYNITLILPIISYNNISYLEKLDDTNYIVIDRLLAEAINGSYQILKSEDINIAKEVILINNDRYKTFINWYIDRYQNRIILKNLLDLIQFYNVNATPYKKLETPLISFVVGSYNSEVNAPVNIKEEPKEEVNKNLKPQASYGFTSYLLLAILTIIVGVVVAYIALRSL